MTYKEVLQAAQGQMGPCRACPVCNGRACGGTIPGPGAKGSGTVAVRNFDAWRNVRLNMDTIHENFEPDTSLTLFGRSFKYPFFAGPVGAMTLHYGDKYNDLDYNNILVPACAAAGIAAFTGDGTNHKVMEGAAAAITACGGTAQGQSTMAKLNTKMGISMKTLTDRSTRNLAEMLSEGSSQGVMDCIKSQKDYPDAAPGSKRLMQKLQDFEEDNRIKLEQFL